jgi:hypothetical protein
MRIMGNVGKMGENRIIEQQRSDKNYRTTKKVRSKFRYIYIYIFFIPSEENRIIEQQGTVNNRTFVLLNFRSIIPALTVELAVEVRRGAEEGRRKGRKEAGRLT